MKKSTIAIWILKINTVILSHKNAQGVVEMLVLYRNSQSTHTSAFKVSLGMRKRTLLQINAVGKVHLTTFLLFGCTQQSPFHTTEILDTVQEEQKAAWKSAELQLHWCEAFQQEVLSKILHRSLLWKEEDKKF